MYGYNDIAASAARLCLNLPFSGLESPYLHCITAEHLSKLYKFHLACGEAASTVASSDRTWFLSLDKKGSFATHRHDLGHDVSGFNCQSCSIQDIINNTWAGRPYPRCVWNYLHCSTLILAHHLTRATTTEAFVLKSSSCNVCAPYMRGYLLKLSMALGREIKKAVERVSQPYQCTHCLTFAMLNGACSYLAGSVTQGCFRVTK